RHSLKIRQEKLGGNAPEGAATLVKLAEGYEGQKQYDKAEPLLQQSLDIRRSRNGDDHPIVARTEERLQVLRQKKEDEVRVVWLKAFDGKAQDTRLGLKDVKQRELALPNGVAKILAEKDERVFEPMFMKVAPPTPAQAAVEALFREARVLVKF